VYDTVTADVAGRWLEGGGNIGVACSGSLVVVDVDAPGRVRPLVGEVFGAETFTVRTPGGGFHLYYNCGEYSRNWSWSAGGDELASVRATAGRLVVAPPSRHPSGGQYTVFVDAPVATVEPDAFREFARRVESITTADDAADERGDQDGAGRGRVARGDGLDELDRLVDHDSYRAEVRDALEDPVAGHDRRQWVAGFLLDAVGLSVDETVRVIDEFNCWRNFDRAVTERQVRAVNRSNPGGRR